MYDPKAHLKRLVEIHAPSGYEQPVADALRDDRANVGTGGNWNALRFDGRIVSI